MPEPDDQGLAKSFAEDRRLVAEARSLRLPAVRTHQEMAPFGFGQLNPQTTKLHLQVLIDLRARHQNRQAALGVRTKASAAISDPDVPAAPVSLHRQLMTRYHDIARGQQDLGMGTGSDRAARWGNSANAAVVADAATRQVGVTSCHNNKNSCP
jgi:aspartokinase